MKVTRGNIPKGEKIDSEKVKSYLKKDMLGAIYPNYEKVIDRLGDYYMDFINKGRKNFSSLEEYKKAQEKKINQIKIIKEKLLSEGDTKTSMKNLEEIIKDNPDIF